MRTPARILFGALAAALVLASAVSTASARRFELSNQSFRLVWAHLIFQGGGAEVECPVTLEGSFHSRTLSKVSGQLVGYITRAIVAHPCEKNEGWALNGVEVTPSGASPQTLPWHIQYNSFSGTLPTISLIRVALIDASFLVEVFNITCLYRSTQTKPQFGNINVVAGQATSMDALPENRVPKAAGQSILCPAEGELSGNATIRLQGSTTTLIFVRLVQ
jgi:hypothetical protein